MSNYTKATNFATKDTLPTGDANKIVKGTEIDNEFNAISGAISSKADIASPTFTGTPAAPTAAAATNTTQVATTAHVFAERTNTATLTNKTLTSPTINTPAITGGTITGITDLTVADGGTGVSTIAANAVVLGNGTSAIQTVAPSTNGNVLISNGTTWTSAALTAVVTSAVAGNGIAVSGATGAVTFAAACPTQNTVGSYCFSALNVNWQQSITFGSNYSAGTGVIQIQAAVFWPDYKTEVSNALSGTWKWMAASSYQDAGLDGMKAFGIACRVS